MSMKTTLRRTWPVLVAYALFSLWGVGCLSACLFLVKGGLSFAPGSILAIAGLFVAAGIGHVLGNVLGLTGFRLGPILGLFFLVFLGASFTGAFVGPVVLYAMVAAFAALGGYLGIGSRLDVVASWYPLSFSVGAAIVWMNAHGAVGTFSKGAKHSLWDPFTIMCLGGAAFFMLVFLATRNALGLTVWQEVGRPRGAGIDASEGIVNARPGRGSIVVLMLATLVVLGTTAAISPYLFRTAHDDQGEPREQKQKPQKGDGEGEEEQPQEEKPDDDPFDWEQLADLLRLALKVFLGLLVVVLLALIFLYVILPPFRRRWFLKHLVRPVWPVAPTARVMNLWRRALASLAMVEVEPGPGEPPTELARRVETELGALPGLAVAAAIVERVHYAGRGLGPGDEDAMRAAILAFVAAFDPKGTFRKKLSAAFRQTPEVES